MQDVEVMKLVAEQAYKELLDSIEGLTAGQAWAEIKLLPGEYMHSEGSILSVVAHVAACKFIYGSCGYRNLEVRWRDVVARLEGLWPNWSAAKAYLEESHRYWMASWADETDLSRTVQRFDLKEYPNWKIIATVTQHDCYHAGQIQFMRAILAPSATPPPGEGDAWRRDCGQLPSW
jgi:uncharacterized damage-inducible protein DinB